MFKTIRTYFDTNEYSSILPYTLCVQLMYWIISYNLNTFSRSVSIFSSQTRAIQSYFPHSKELVLHFCWTLNLIYYKVVNIHFWSVFLPPADFRTIDFFGWHSNAIEGSQLNQQKRLWTLPFGIHGRRQKRAWFLNQEVRIEYIVGVCHASLTFPPHKISFSNGRKYTSKILNLEKGNATFYYTNNLL